MTPDSTQSECELDLDGEAATWMTRRTFVGRSLGLIGLSTTVPGFLARSVWAMGTPDSSGRTTASGRILVVVQLAGGNDGLNTLVPFRDDAYYAARPKLAVPAANVLRMTDALGLHPAARGLKELYDDGLLAVVQGVGYPNPNRSHFVSTDIWETADPRKQADTGWIGRFVDSTCTGAEPPDPRLALALRQEVPLSLKGTRFSPLAFTDPSRLRWQAHASDPHAEDVFLQLSRPESQTTVPAFGPGSSAVEPLDYLRRVAVDLRESGKQIRAAAESAQRSGRRGGGLTGQLSMVARLIAAGLPTRVYYVSLGGFDTHANQAGRHENLLRQLGDALLSFMSTLKDLRLQDRVLVMTLSEFGRRVAENASGGTDHGTAAPLFLAGTPVQPGIHGQYPGLSRLDAGDLIYTTDFRSVYGAILSDWLAADAHAILGGSQPPMRLIRV